MLKVRLRRMGTRNAPFYRVVVADSRKVPTSSAVEEIGHYDPRQTPTTVHIDRARIDYWIGQGAQLSKTVRELVAKSRSAAPATEARTGASPASDATGGGS